MRRLVCGLLVFGLWSGAASFAAASSWAEDDAKVVACFAVMDANPALAVVNAKFARREPSAAQLGDARFASASEVEALRLRVSATRPCRALRLGAVRAHHPLLEPAYTTLYYQADQVFVYLIDGWISYGAANRLAQASLGAFKGREQAFFAARSDEARRALSNGWDEALQRAHSDPPPSAPWPVTCAWRELNIACR
ncbi:MAG: hypothetical protein K8S25_01460 [Alphaproteobacteria bacterium]|nr:hypothetical protein [Alphaproteobacteria bacterium]